MTNERTEAKGPFESSMSHLRYNSPDLSGPIAAIWIRNPGDLSEEIRIAVEDIPAVLQGAVALGLVQLDDERLKR